MYKRQDLRPLFDAILSHIPAPEGDPDAPLQLLISTIDYNDYVGRIGIGRIERGGIQAGQMAIRCAYGSSFTSPAARLGGLYEFDGLKRVPCESARVGDIVAVSGFDELFIGDTICDPAMEMCIRDSARGEHTGSVPRGRGFGCAHCLRKPFSIAVGLCSTAILL